MNACASCGRVGTCGTLCQWQYAQQPTTVYTPFVSVPVRNDGSLPPPPNAPNALRSCWCYECLDAPEHGINNPVLNTFVVCPACGNKRCPRATDHRFACTGSNAEGQFGSRYGGRATTSDPTTEKR